MTLPEGLTSRDASCVIHLDYPVVLHALHMLSHHDDLVRRDIHRVPFRLTSPSDEYSCLASLYK